MPYQGKIYGDSLPFQFRIPSATETQDGVMTKEQVQLLDSIAGGGGTIPEPANTVFAGPVAGPDALPQFRPLDLADLPSGYPAGDLSGVVDIAAGGTNSAAPLNNNRAMVSVGGAIVESNASTSSQVLVGGTPPAFGSVPAAAIPSTGVPPGSYPSLGEISTFTVAGDGRLTSAGSTTNGSALTSLNADNLSAGTVAQARGGLGVDASALSNGVLVKSGGVMSSTTAPTMSGVNISDGTVRLDSIASQGASLNAILRWNGTNWGITTSPSANFLLTSGASAPGWSNSLTGITINAATNSLSNIATSMLASGFNLSATQGGTGQTSYTVGDVLYASTTTALSKLAAGTSGRVLTANGAGVAPSYQALPTGTTVSTTLTGTTWTSTTFVDTGQKITLPSGGLWQITFKVRNYCQVSSGAPGVNTFELYDNTAAAVITDSQAFGAADYIGGGSGFGTTTTWSVIIDVASGRDIKLYVKRLAGPTYAASGTGMASDTTEGTSTATAVLLRA